MNGRGVFWIKIFFIWLLREGLSQMLISLGIAVAWLVVKRVSCLCRVLQGMSLLLLITLYQDVNGAVKIKGCIICKLHRTYNSNSSDSLTL